MAAGKGTRKLVTEADGRALAIDMLREIERCPQNSVGTFQWHIEAQYRDEGTEQDNVVLRHLAAVQATGSPDALAGFCSILTEFVGSSIEGCDPSDPAEFYGCLTERQITGKPGPWPKLGDEDRAEEAAFRGFMARLAAGA